VQNPPLRLGFLASNNGASMRAIILAIEAGALAAEARLVISNKRDAPALAFASEHGVPARTIATAQDAGAADAALAQALKDADVQLVVLSGYLRKLGPKTLAAYAGRVLNIHPGPLPRFGGQGMYGRRVHEAVAAAGVAESAVTVHIVDEEYDHGPTLIALSVPLAPGDDAAGIEAKVTAAEAGVFVEVVRRICEGTLALPESPWMISDNLP
jgi:phosphoribosylglycinamide formyltransferase 1